MKQIFAMVIAAMMAFFTGCVSAPHNNSGENEGTDAQPEAERETVSEIAERNGRWYIDYRGQPFSLIGGQIRADGLTNRGEGDKAPPLEAPAAMEHEDIETYVKAAKDFGLNVVEIPVEWRDIEPQRDVYDFTALDAYMDACNKHGMKMEMLWFSTNMVGDSHSFHIPQYICDDEITYPRLKGNYNYFSWMYGITNHYRLDTPALKEREYKAAKAITDHMYEYNKANGEKYPVIGIQVHNEPDGMVRWRADPSQADLAVANNMSRLEIWQMTLRALDNAGKGFKSGKYKVYTRANMTVSMGSGEFTEAPGCSPKDVLALDGIDIVGDDPYNQSYEGIASAIEGYTLEGNYPHIAENMGAYSSGAALMLSALTAGGGYCLYDFATPEFFVWMNDYNQSTYQMDQGVLNPDLSEKPHSAEVSAAAKGLSACSAPLAVLPLENISAVGLNARSGKTFTETVTVGGIEVGFKTVDGAKGFCFTDGEAITLYATANSEFTIQSIAKVGYIGYYEGERFINGEKIYPADTVTVNGRVIRISLA